MLDSMRNAVDSTMIVKDTTDQEPIAHIEDSMIIPDIQVPPPMADASPFAQDEPMVMILSAPTGSDTPFADNVYLDSLIASQAKSLAPNVTILNTPPDTLYYYLDKSGAVEIAKFVDTSAAKVHLQIELPNSLDPRFVILSTTNNIDETWGANIDILTNNADGTYELNAPPLAIQIPGLFYYKVYHQGAGTLYFIGKFVFLEKSKKEMRRYKRKEKRRLRKSG